MGTAPECFIERTALAGYEVFQFMKMLRIATVLPDMTPVGSETPRTHIGKAFSMGEARRNRWGYSRADSRSDKAAKKAAADAYSAVREDVFMVRLGPDSDYTVWREHKQSDFFTTAQ